jgi:hypothetical protein
MTSASEAYLNELADRTFLKPWSIANPFHRAGKEIADLLVPFGQDIILFSDKACRFNSEQEPARAWARWRRAAIDESLKQLGGAVRRLERPDCAIFTDHAAKDPLAYPAPSLEDRRYHMVAVVRPDHDPHARPAGWPGLTYSDLGGPASFQVGPMFIGTSFVHVVDGADLELLLAQLDTAPDLIKYLTSRAAGLATLPGVTFSEPDLLAVATTNWMNGEGFTLKLDDAERRMLTTSPWEAYAGSERANHTKGASKDSYSIDRLIGEFHREYLERRASGVKPVDPERHEQAMRLLAMESRFARRMIVASLKSILDEEQRQTFWASTVPSPTTRGVRYVWLAYPRKPEELSEEAFVDGVLNHLSQYLVVASDTFKSDSVIIGVAVPNRSAQDNLLVMRVFDASERSEALRQEAEYLRGQGVFSDLQPEHRLHRP